MPPERKNLQGKAFCEWLTPFSKDLSNKILARTGIDRTSTRSSFSNLSTGRGLQDSWFKARSYVFTEVIAWPSSMCFPETGEAGAVAIKARKIRLKPRKEHERVLRKWMKSAR